MKGSVVVNNLAALASKVKLEVTPENVDTLAASTNKLFEEAAKLINRLEAEEAAEEEKDSE